MTGDRIKLKAYGKPLLVQRIGEAWVLSHLSPDGKRSAAHNIAIPAELDRQGVIRYIADLLHESASEANPDVQEIE
jgi:hypothetical protein